MKYLKALAVAGLAMVLAAGQVKAQVAGFSFSNVSSGLNDPMNLGDPASPFNVMSDSGATLTATFSTLSPSSQFGIHDNNAILVGDAPIAGNLVFGGRTNYPTDADAAGAAILQIKFSALITTISFDYLTAALGVNGGSVDENLKVEAVGSAVGYGLVADQTQNSTLYYYQGHVSGTTTAFDTVILSVTPAQGDLYAEFGLDNLNVVLAQQPSNQVPEPGALALLVGAGLPLAWRLRRRVA